MPEIPPFSARFTPHPTPSGRKGNGSTQKLSGDPQARQRETEKMVQEKIESMHHQVAEAQRQTSERIDDLKDHYSRQVQTEEARAEDTLEATRAKGYERIRDLQRAQQAEIARVRREGEKELSQAQDYYRNSIDGVMTRGEEELNQVVQGKARQLEYESAMAANELEVSRGEHQARITDARASQEKSINELVEQNRGEYERMKESVSQERELAHKQFQDSYKGELKTQAESIRNLNASAAHKLKEVRMDTSRKLAAYENRQRDPFYQILDVGAELSDEGDSFVLTARIPPHEQRNISVAVRGDQLVLSGYRRSQEKVDIEPGRSQSTSAYQAFTETFPLPGPVDAKQLRREFDGDMLLIYIPKKQGFQANSKPFQAKTPERARVERPRFPDNIVVSEAPKDPDTGETAPSPHSKGSGTLI